VKYRMTTQRREAVKEYDNGVYALGYWIVAAVFAAIWFVVGVGVGTSL
jgi:hypothetical protein